MKPNIQRIPIRTKRGREILAGIRKAFRGDTPSPILECDYREVEERLMAGIPPSCREFRLDIYVYDHKENRFGAVLDDKPPTGVQMPLFGLNPTVWFPEWGNSVGTRVPFNAKTMALRRPGTGCDCVRGCGEKTGFEHSEHCIDCWVGECSQCSKLLSFGTYEMCSRCAMHDRY